MVYVENIAFKGKRATFSHLKFADIAREKILSDCIVDIRRWGKTWKEVRKENGSKTAYRGIVNPVLRRNQKQPIYRDPPGTAECSSVYKLAD